MLNTDRPKGKQTEKKKKKKKKAAPRFLVDLHFELSRGG